MNPWLQHLKKYKKAHPGISLKQAMKQAKKTYKKGGNISKTGARLRTGGKISKTGSRLRTSGKTSKTGSRLRTGGKTKRRPRKIKTDAGHHVAT